MLFRIADILFNYYLKIINLKIYLLCKVVYQNKLKTVLLDILYKLLYILSA